MDLKETMQIKALFYFMGRGLEIISRTNEDFNEEFEDLDGIFQWTVGDVSAYMAGDLNIIGDIQMGMKFSQVAEWLTEMLSDLLS